MRSNKVIMGKHKRGGMCWLLAKLFFYIVLFLVLIIAYVSITKVEDIVLSCDISNIDYSKSIIKIRRLPISINVANASGDSTTTSRMTVLYEAEDPIMPHIRIFVPDFIDSLMSGSSIVDLIKKSRCSLDYDECDFTKEQTKTGISPFRKLLLVTFDRVCLKPDAGPSGLCHLLIARNAIQPAVLTEKRTRLLEEERHFGFETLSADVKHPGVVAHAGAAARLTAHRHLFAPRAETATEVDALQQRFTDNRLVPYRQSTEQR